MQSFRKVTIIILLVFPLSFLNAQNWDIETLHSINSNENVFLKNYSRVTSETVPYVSVGTPLVMGIVALVKKDDELLKNSLYIGASLAVDITLTYTMKMAVNRQRPYVTYPELVQPYKIMGDKSFPSGHTSMAFALATSLTLKYPKWYVIAPSYFWAASVGYSRMNLGVHYPSDVMAGAILGAGSAYLTYVLNECFRKKRENKKLLSNVEIWY